VIPLVSNLADWFTYSVSVKNSMVAPAAGLPSGSILTASKSFMIESDRYFVLTAHRVGDFLPPQNVRQYWPGGVVTPSLPHFWNYQVQLTKGSVFSKTDNPAPTPTIGSFGTWAGKQVEYPVMLHPKEHLSVKVIGSTVGAIAATTVVNLQATVCFEGYAVGKDNLDKFNELFPELVNAFAVMGGQDQGENE
jgi:hypothetical protein